MSQRIVLSADHQYLRPTAEQIATLFADHQGKLLHRGRNEIRRLLIDGKPIVVKRYKRPNIVQRVVYPFFRQSKCRRAYDYAALFRQRGIATPRELAYVEHCHHGLFARYDQLCGAGYALQQHLYHGQPDRQLLLGL